jgi:hypothetical protein
LFGRERGHCVRLFLHDERKTTTQSRDREAFHDEFPTAYYTWRTFVVDWLSRVRCEFDGDLDAMLILAVIGLGEKSRMSQVPGDGRDTLFPLADGLLAEIPFESNASRISAVTGIPRLSVRRKLKSMADRDWLALQPGGSVRLKRTPDASAPDASTPVARDLDPLTEYIFSAVAGLVAELSVQAEKRPRR